MAIETKVINVEGRHPIVVAKIFDNINPEVGCSFDAVIKLCKLLHTDSDQLFPDGIPSYLMMKSTYSARCVCDPRDEFNEEKGKTKARKRVMDKYYSILNKKIYLGYTSLVKAMRPLEEYCIMNSPENFE